MVTRFLIAVGIHPVMAFIHFGFGLWFAAFVIIALNFRVDGQEAAWYALWYTLADIVVCIFLLSFKNTVSARKIIPINPEQNQNIGQTDDNQQANSAPQMDDEINEQGPKKVSKDEAVNNRSDQIFPSKEDAYNYCRKHDIDISIDDENLIRVAESLHRVVSNMEKQKAQEAAG